MGIKVISIILFVLFLLPFGLGISAGLNRTLKIGLFITALGFCINFLAWHFYPQFLVPFSNNTEAYDHGLYVRKWLLNGMDFSLVVSIIGGTITYVASVVQGWKKRRTLLPFLFGREKG